MANELVTYYEQYRQAHAGGGYTMTKSKDTSRVRLLETMIRKYVPAGGKILDVGCGDMYLSTILPEYEWVGIDVAPDMSNDKAIKVDLMVPPYPLETGTFHAAVCSEVLEHLWDLRVVHREVRRLLKSQGTYIISTPNFDHIDHVIYNYRQLVFDPGWTHLFEHIRQYTPESHKRDLVSTGFEVYETTGCDAHFSRFFAEARETLLQILTKQFKIPVDMGSVDVILGLCFPNISHTTMLISKPDGNFRP